MFPILDVPTAQATILKRVPMDELDIPESLLQRLEQTFGEPVSPAEAVRRILRDVRTGGDAALSRWTAKLDAADLPTARVPQEKIAAALESLDPALREVKRGEHVLSLTLTEYNLLYLLMIVYTTLTNFTSRKFQISFALIGPTEIRILAITASIWLYFNNTRFIHLGFIDLNFFEAILLLLIIVFVPIYLLSTVVQMRRLAKEDPLPGRPQG